MQFLREHKNLILGGVLAVVAVWAYFSFFSGGGDSEDLLTASSQSSALAGANLLTTLGLLESVKLDEAIFSDPVFLSLVDFGIDIPPQPVGRPNPFAPLPPSSGGSTALPSGITTGTASQ